VHLVGFFKIIIYCANVMKIIRLHIQQNQQIKMFTFVIIIVDDKSKKL